MGKEVSGNFFITFAVRRNDYGTPIGLDAKSVTKNRPAALGDYCLQVSVTVPVEVIEPSIVEIKIESPADAISALQQTAKDLSKP